MGNEKFRCEICGLEIEMDDPRSPEELKKEMIETFGDLGEKENNDFVKCCDDCWLKLQHKKSFDEDFVMEVEEVYKEKGI